MFLNKQKTKEKKEEKNFNKENLKELKKGFYKFKIKRNELKSEINEKLIIFKKSESNAS